VNESNNGAMLVQTTVKVVEFQSFSTLKAALDYMAALDKRGVKGIRINVDLTGAKYNKYNQLEQGDYPWKVSYPAAIAPVI
jgi:hypothetical protein